MAETYEFHGAEAKTYHLRVWYHTMKYMPEERDIDVAVVPCVHSLYGSPRVDVMDIVDAAVAELAK